MITLTTSSSPRQMPQLIFGAANWGSPDSSFVNASTTDRAQAFLDVLKRHNVTTIDTSRNYPRGAPGTSEDLIGTVHAASQGFVIDTKVSNEKGDHKYERIIQSVDGSLASLGVSKVRVEYLHWPDRSVKLEEPLRALNQKYNEGKFEKFGISNYSAEEVEEILGICEREGWVKPSVYQGHYNALCRRGEKQLFPTLRANNISFYAYSPGAGGAFSKSSTRLARQDVIGDMTRMWYGATKTAPAQAAAERHGISGYELAIRWVLHHSALDAGKDDAIILGASRPEQLEDTLRSCEKGPLPQELVDLMDQLWEKVEADGQTPSYSPWVDEHGKANTLEFSNSNRD